MVVLVELAANRLCVRHRVACVRRTATATNTASLSGARARLGHRHGTDILQPFRPTAPRLCHELLLQGDGVFVALQLLHMPLRVAGCCKVHGGVLW